ncbi:MAG TPA: hypothetical protein VLX68_09155 [Chitinivibrionales bacterium]|nr:hypothetical protein [Chitinivibrionales bacterium]
MFVRPEGHEKCCTSHGSHGNVAHGSGKLDDHGYWEFPCYECAREWERQFPMSGSAWPFATEFSPAVAQYLPGNGDGI